MPDDANEISFSKHETLEFQDLTQGRKMVAGQERERLDRYSVQQLPRYLIDDKFVIMEDHIQD
jgi:hypothetical protein